MATWIQLAMMKCMLLLLFTSLVTSHMCVCVCVRVHALYAGV